MTSLILLFLGAFVLAWCVGGLAVRSIAPLFAIKVSVMRAVVVVAAAHVVALVIFVALLLLSAASMSISLAVLTFVVPALTGILMFRAKIPASFAKAAALWLVASAGQAAVALVLHLFFWQAWTIPTGSMAPTLAGDHFEVSCENCGRTFPIDASFFGRSEPTLAAQCANCRATTVVKLKAASPLAFDPRAAPPIPPGAKRGDRIIALKHRLPRRWELAVFRAPHQMDSTHVARVAGLPGETVELAEGDVFINGLREARPADRFDSMWLLVSDSSFVPKQADKAEPGWRGAKEKSSWKQQAGTWAVDAGDSDELLFDRAIVDQIEYFSHRGSLRDRLEPVGDVRLDVEVQSLTGAGDLILTWSYDNREVTARFTAKGTAWLEFSDQISESAADGLNWTAGHTVGLAVRDGVASLLIDGRVIVTRQVESQKIEDHRQERDPEKPVPARLSVTAEKINVTVSRLVVRRDAYYLGDLSRHDGSGCNGCTGKPFTLGAAEYFMLGDNSPFSADSRLWDTVDPSLAGRVQVGAVPEDSIKAIAHWVYWPLGRARAVE